jgi:hypothetical protein
MENVCINLERRINKIEAENHREAGRGWRMRAISLFIF